MSLSLQGIAFGTSGSASNLGFTYHDAIIIEPENYEVKVKNTLLLTYDPSIANDSEIKIKELRDGVFYVISINDEIHLVRKNGLNIEFYTAYA